MYYVLKYAKNKLKVMNRKPELYSVVTKINFTCVSNLMTCVEGLERKDPQAKPSSNITESTMVVIHGHQQL